MAIKTLTGSAKTKKTKLKNSTVQETALLSLIKIKLERGVVSGKFSNKPEPQKKIELQKWFGNFSAHRSFFSGRSQKK